MARHSAPSQPKAVKLTPDKMRIAIARLQKRIVELQVFDPISVNERSDPRIGLLERTVDETLTSIFGFGTADYNRYHYCAATLDRAPVVMGREVGRLQFQVGLAKGKSDAISTLQGIVARFNEELELASGQPTLETPGQAGIEGRGVFVVHGHDEGGARKGRTLYRAPRPGADHPPRATQ